MLLAAVQRMLRRKAAFSQEQAGRAVSDLSGAC